MAPRMKRRHRAKLKLANQHDAPSELPTFLEHIYELRRRLFWVVAVILVTSSAAYPFLNGIIGILTAPLGNQQLYYLTPVGGLSFSIKLCVYVGVLAAVPIVMYHLYRFLEPLMGQWRRSALFYVGLSSAFAVAGILFAYFVSLPGALHFLTGMNIDHIQAMLTVDSYLSFVLTYLLGAALLFQIPLLLTIVNTMTPLKPSKLMKIQRFVILGAFVLAAIISPTPDVLNQVLFALPIIAMYQIGVLLVWLQNRARAKRSDRVATPASLSPATLTPALHRRPEPATATPTGLAPAVTPMTRAPQGPPRPVTSIDGIAPAARRPVARQASAPLPPRPLRVPGRSVDGFTPYRPPQPVRSS